MSETVEKKKQSGFGETVKVIIQALLLALVIRSLLFQPFSIPSGSMMPTLLIGDYLFVSKYSYGYSRYSFPFSPPVFSGRIWSGDPERGDIAVFRLPSNPRIDYIKRVVGLPGDRIQMIEGVLHINGEAIERERAGTFRSQEGPEAPVEAPIFRETLPNGVSYETLDINPNSAGDNTREFLVPDGHYFMMGDNRDNSADSRFEVGFVPLENFIGRAEMIFFSIGGGSSPLEIWKWPTELRFGRLFELTE